MHFGRYSRFDLGFELLTIVIKYHGSHLFWLADGMEINFIHSIHSNRRRCHWHWKPIFEI